MDPHYMSNYGLRRQEDSAPDCHTRVPKDRSRHLKQLEENSVASVSCTNKWFRSLNSTFTTVSQTGSGMDASSLSQEDKVASYLTSPAMPVDRSTSIKVTGVSTLYDPFLQTLAIVWPIVSFLSVFCIPATTQDMEDRDS